MAISAPHYRCLRELHRRGELPQGGSILEIGEANWYGDMPAEVVAAELGAAEEFPDAIRSEWAAFDFVKWIYRKFFGTSECVSIDMGGTPESLRIDLNGDFDPIPLGRQFFTTVINHGTAEHIFNIGQVFRTMHDHCAVGGLMIHESPFTGWIDHGFYTIQPTAYFDLCAANGYQLVYMAVTQIEQNLAVPIESREQLLTMAQKGGVPNNSMLWVAMRKQSDAEFKIPMQGVYAGTLSGEAAKAWKDFR